MTVAVEIGGVGQSLLGLVGSIVLTHAVHQGHNVALGSPLDPLVVSTS